MTTTVTQSSHQKRIKVSVGAGDTPVPVYINQSLCDYAIVTAEPGSGGSMLVEATWSSEADIIAGTAAWFPWTAGTVTAAANQRIDKATAVRFTATTQPGVGEIAL